MVRTGCFPATICSMNTTLRTVLRGRILWLLLALAAITAVTFAPVRHFDFVEIDDPTYVTDNAMVQRGLTLEGATWALTTGHAPYWHPLTWMSHMLDVELYGRSAGGHHLTSLVLHVVNVLLLFGLLVTLTGAVWRSTLVAALFAVHPVHVESVAWIAERKDVLSTLFGILSLWVYAGFVRARAAAGTPPPPDGAVRTRRVWYGLVIGCYALSLMAKPMFVTLPFLMLLLDAWPLNRIAWPAAAPRKPGRQARRKTADAGEEARGTLLVSAWLLVREKLPLFALAAAAAIAAFLVQEQVGAVSSLEGFPLGLRLQNAVVSVVFYLRSMVWPEGLAALYPLPDAIPFWQPVGAAVVIAGVTYVAFRLARRVPSLAVGWLWYVGTLVPVLGIIQVGVQARADRFTYFPSIGVFIIVAWGAAELAASARAARVVVSALAIAAVLGCAVAARAQTAYWKDNVALWTRDYMVTQHADEFDAHMALGSVLGNQGRFEEARQHYTGAVRLKPASDTAHMGLGMALARLGLDADAARELTEALRLNPANDAARLELARLRSRGQD